MVGSKSCFYPWTNPHGPLRAKIKLNYCFCSDTTPPKKERNNKIPNNHECQQTNEGWTLDETKAADEYLKHKLAEK